MSRRKPQEEGTCSNKCCRCGANDTGKSRSCRQCYPDSGSHVSTGTVQDQRGTSVLGNTKAQSASFKVHSAQCNSTDRGDKGLR